MRVLLVEDERGLAETVRRGLTAEGFVVEVARDGAKASGRRPRCSSTSSCSTSCCRGVNGYQVLEQLRERGVWTPILMLTAKDGEYDQTDAFDLGADDYLTKPFSFIVLVARLRALIRRGAPERPVGAAAGDLSARPGAPAGRARRRARSPSPRASSACWSSSCATAGDVVTKTEILDGVWDPRVRGRPERRRGLRRLPPAEGRRAVRPARPSRPCAASGYRLAADGG